MVFTTTDRVQRRASLMRWGLVLSSAKGPSAGAPLVDARGETVAERPAFRTALTRWRRLIPADEFYRWRCTGKCRTPK